MPDSPLTLVDITRLNDVSVQDEGATEIFNAAPFLSMIAAQTASHGTQHKYLKESAAPTVGFRAVNVGRDRSKSGDTLVTEDLKYLDCAFDVDKAIASGSKRGLDYLMRREGMRHLKAGFAAAERQIFSGTGADAGGYAGLRDNAGLNQLSDAQVVNAGGGAAASKQDIWLIRIEPNTDCCLLVGNDGVIQVDPYYEQTVVDGTGKKYQAYVMDCSAWLGFQIASTRSVVRICNVNNVAGATTNVCTDALLEQGFELFPAERPPTHIVMARRQVSQLKRSRTATRTDGAAAPRPDNYEGIPIVMTDNLDAYTTAVA